MAATFRGWPDFFFLPFVIDLWLFSLSAWRTYLSFISITFSLIALPFGFLKFKISLIISCLLSVSACDFSVVVLLFFFSELNLLMYSIYYYPIVMWLWSSICFFRPEVTVFISIGSFGISYLGSCSTAMVFLLRAWSFCSSAAQQGEVSWNWSRGMGPLACVCLPPPLTSKT